MLPAEMFFARVQAVLNALPSGIPIILVHTAVRDIYMAEIRAGYYVLYFYSDNPMGIQIAYNNEDDEYIGPIRHLEDEDHLDEFVVTSSQLSDFVNVFCDYRNNGDHVTMARVLSMYSLAPTPTDQPF